MKCKYVIVVVLLASIACVEFFHELTGGGAPGAALCVGPQTGQDAIDEMLVRHLHSHR